MQVIRHKDRSVKQINFFVNVYIFKVKFHATSQNIGCIEKSDLKMYISRKKSLKMLKQEEHKYNLFTH